MRIHAIQTSRVRIKQAQIEGRGHGPWRLAQPILSRDWAGWAPTYAWAIEHPEDVIVVDTGANAGPRSLPRGTPISGSRAVRGRAASWRAARRSRARFARSARPSIC